jgi:hypothetical protein
MKARFNVISGARHECTLCGERGDSVFLDSYSPWKYRAYVCYGCIRKSVEEALFPPAKVEPAQDEPAKEVEDAAAKKRKKR